MLTAEQKKSFETNGYLLIPNMLAGEEVTSLRNFFQTKFESPDGDKHSGDTEKVLFDVYSRYPEVRWLLFHQPTINAIKELLGEDFVVLRESSVHYDFYSTWHKDTTTLERSGRKFHLQPNFRMVQVAYYLQPNTKEYGGGLDVQAGSHLSKDPFVGKDATLLGRVRTKLGKQNVQAEKVEIQEGVVSIPNKAGDLVIFDFRISHRATPTQQPGSRVQKKLAIFLSCSSKTPYIEQYHDFISSRPSYVYLKNFSYPVDFLAQAKSAGINLA